MVKHTRTHVLILVMDDQNVFGQAYTSSGVCMWLPGEVGTVMWHLVPEMVWKGHRRARHSVGLQIEQMCVYVCLCVCLFGDNILIDWVKGQRKASLWLDEGSGGGRVNGGGALFTGHLSKLVLISVTQRA